MFRIPTQNNITQLNESGFSGILDSTRNIDLDEVGVIKLAQPTFVIASEDDDADLEEAVSMYRAVTDWGGVGEDLIIISDDTFRFGSAIDLGGGIQNETSGDGAPTPGPDDDVIYFVDWVITDGSVIKYRDGGSWTTISGTPVSTSDTNVLGLFPYQNAMLVANGNKVALVDDNWNVVETLILPERYSVRSMDSAGQYAYIGTKDISGNEGALFRWNGATSAHNGIFTVGASAIDSVRHYKQSVACVTNHGELLYFTGSSFKRLGKFPIYDKKTIIDDDRANYNLTSNRGMIADHDDLYIMVHDEADSASEYHVMNGGVWCYKPGVGLHHKFSPSRNYFAQISISGGGGSVNPTTDLITPTLGGATIPETGTAVRVDFPTNLPGLKSGKLYFIVKSSATSFGLATTPGKALAGELVDLTADATSTVRFNLLQRVDYGATYVETRPTTLSYLPAVTRDVKNPVMGSTLTDNALVDKCYINAVNPDIQNKGGIETAKIRPGSVSSKFSKIGLKYRKLQYGDRIIVKYRTSDYLTVLNSTVLQDITWTSGTTFTTTSDWSDVLVGMEINIIGGQGSGQSFTISDISESSGTYTVTTEETNALVSSGDDSLVTISNWIKATTLDYTNDLGYFELSIDAGSSAWIQYKIELEGVGTAIEELIIDDKPIN